MSAAVSNEAARIDVWLWRARFFKTRTLSGKYAESGRIRINRNGAVQRVTKPSAAVRIGDVLTFPLRRAIRVVEVKGLGMRRGPAAEAQMLYADLTEKT